MHLVYPGSGCILLYPGYTAGKAGGPNPTAGMERLLDLHGCGAGRATPGPGRGDLNNR